MNTSINGSAASGDASQQTGVFYATSASQPKLQALIEGTMTFDELASDTARELYQLVAHCDEPESAGTWSSTFRMTTTSAILPS